MLRCSDLTQRGILAWKSRGGRKLLLILVHYVQAPSLALLPRLGYVCLGLIGLRRYIDEDANWFLDWLFEINSSRVQNDVLNRIEQSRDRLEVDIRRLLHEVSRIAEQALARAKKSQVEGMPAVEAAMRYLDGVK